MKYEQLMKFSRSSPTRHVNCLGSCYVVRKNYLRTTYEVPRQYYISTNNKYSNSSARSVKVLRKNFMSSS